MCPVKLGDCIDVLDNLFRYLDKKSLRTARLVNKTWCDVANHWVRVEIPYADCDKLMLPGHGLSNSLRKVRHIRCFEGIPMWLPTYFRETLLGLELKDIIFDTVAGFKEAVVDSFPNLVVLVLTEVDIVTEKTAILQKDSSRIEVPEELNDPNTRLRKFVVKTGYTDGFTTSFYDWIFRSFPKIMEIENRYEHESTVKRMLQSTQARKLGLKSLKLSLDAENYSNDGGFPQALKSFLNDSLTNFTLLGKAHHSFDGIFDNVNCSQLTNLAAEGVKLRKFGDGCFEKLKHLTISHRAQDSYKFLERMPNLQSITFDSEGRKVIRKSKYPTQVFSSVQEITLIHQLNPRNIADLLTVFPNIDKFNFRDTRWTNNSELDCEIEHGTVVTHGKMHFRVMLRHFPKICPALKSLTFFGPCGLAYDNYWLYSLRDYGNVNWKILEILVEDFPDLEVFEHTDDVDYFAKELNDSDRGPTQQDLEDGVKCMLQWWKCKSSSFEGEEERVDKRVYKEFKRYYDVNGRSPPSSSYTIEKSRRLGFGRKAVEVLLGFPKLRVLRLERAVMTKLQHAILKERLLVLDVKQLYIYG